MLLLALLAIAAERPSVTLRASATILSPVRVGANVPAGDLQVQRRIIRDPATATPVATSEYQ